MTRTEWLLYGAPRPAPTPPRSPDADLRPALTAAGFSTSIARAFEGCPAPRRCLPGLASPRSSPGRLGGRSRSSRRTGSPAPHARTSGCKLRRARRRRALRHAARAGLRPRQLDYGRLNGWLRTRSSSISAARTRVRCGARLCRDADDHARARCWNSSTRNSCASRPPLALVANASLLAKHRLKDLPLARRYAAAVERHARAPTWPLWARQMEIFIPRT